jgi:hypothetical protein
MKVVSNASPLINLARIGELGLLPALYGQVVVPEAVWQEVVIDGTGQAGANEIRDASWISTHNVDNRLLVRALCQTLDAGEAEAIALALELDPALLLMDERLGRESALHMGVRCVGLVGVLIEARHKALLPALKPYLDALRDVAGFRLSDELYARVLRDAHEL